MSQESLAEAPARWALISIGVGRGTVTRLMRTVIHYAAEQGLASAAQEAFAGVLYAGPFGAGSRVDSGYCF